MIHCRCPLLRRGPPRLWWALMATATGRGGTGRSGRRRRGRCGHYAYVPLTLPYLFGALTAIPRWSMLVWVEALPRACACIVLHGLDTYVSIIKLEAARCTLVKVLEYNREGEMVRFGACINFV